MDIHNPQVGPYRITTRFARPGMARFDTCADFIAKSETHPWAKAQRPDDKLCDRSTIGLLCRRPLTARDIILIGKEAGSPEGRQTGQSLVNDLDERLTIYQDHNEWWRFVLPKPRGLGGGRNTEITEASQRRARDWMK